MAEEVQKGLETVKASEKSNCAIRSKKKEEDIFWGEKDWWVKTKKRGVDGNLSREGVVVDKLLEVW